MQVFSIYKITNFVNNKSYIGWTNYKKPITRFKNHCNAAFSYNSQNAIHRALRKYGKDNFSFKILFQSTDKEYIIKEMEPYFIALYKSFGPEGYNMTKGGEGILGYSHTNETKQKMARKGADNPFYGKTHSPETKEHLSSIRKGQSWEEKIGTKKAKKLKKKAKEKYSGKGNPFYGKTHSPETKERLRKAAKLQWEKKRSLDVSKS